MTKISIKTVAEQAGVSTATVSHVINHTRFVREETRQRVLTAIEHLNYQPSAIARSLATNATQTIGLIVSDITNPFFTAVARGVEDVLNRHGYHTIFCNTDEDPVQEDEYLRLLSARQIDGLIIAPTGIQSDRLIRMAASETPIVQMDRCMPGLDAPLVEVDNKEGAYQAIRYLIGLGHRRIAALMGLETISTLRDRLTGYKTALQEAGIPLNDELIVQTNPRFYGENQPSYLTDILNEGVANHQMTPTAFAALQKLLQLPHRPSAIFVTNNQMTLGLLHALKRQGLRCPEDLSLISFDDHDWASLFSPALTVVRQPTYRLGQIAAELLLKLIKKQAISIPSPLSVELVVRDSCLSYTGT